MQTRTHTHTHTHTHAQPKAGVAAQEAWERASRRPGAQRTLLHIRNIKGPDACNSLVEPASLPPRNRDIKESCRRYVTDCLTPALADATHPANAPSHTHGTYRDHASYRTPVFAFFYSVFLHNQWRTTPEKGGFRNVSPGGFPERCQFVFVPSWLWRNTLQKKR